MEVTLLQLEDKREGDTSSARGLEKSTRLLKCMT